MHAWSLLLKVHQHRCEFWLIGLRSSRVRYGYSLQAAQLHSKPHATPLRCCRKPHAAQLKKMFLFLSTGKLLSQQHNVQLVGGLSHTYFLGNRYLNNAFVRAGQNNYYWRSHMIVSCQHYGLSFPNVGYYSYVKVACGSNIHTSVSVSSRLVYSSAYRMQCNVVFLASKSCMVTFLSSITNACPLSFRGGRAAPTYRTYVYPCIDHDTYRLR